MRHFHRETERGSHRISPGLYSEVMITRRTLLWWIVAPAVFVFLAFATVSLVLLRPSVIKQYAEKNIKEKLNLDATFDSISLSFRPRPTISGRGLTIRVPNRADLPPFITIDHFYVNIGLFSALRRHVGTVHAGGMKITVPPSDVRRAMKANGGPAPADDGESEKSDDGDKADGGSRVVIDEFVTHDAELTFVRRDPRKRPLIFAIHDLTVRDLGLDRKMPYEARLTNPIPRGEVKASGTIGPWQRDTATNLPLDGKYTFSDADLGTINGIGGILQSTGTFSGRLTEINARGTSVTPDFSLDLGGTPVRLTASFDTTIDGTDGTTVLNRVEAMLLETPIAVTGAISNLEGPGRHDIDLQVAIENGRIEDLMTLVLEDKETPLTGDVRVKTTLKLPPGPGRVRDRLALDGEFGLGEAQFTDAQIQGKMRELSRRSQGKDKDDPLGRVMTSLRGKFTIGGGRLTMPDLRFDVPGASVRLRGNYALAGGAIDFRGTLRMKATVSEAVGGLKSWFIKPFDPIFRKSGSGSVIPIKITGTRKAPKFGIEAGKIFN